MTITICEGVTLTACENTCSNILIALDMYRTYPKIADFDFDYEAYWHWGDTINELMGL